MGIATYFSLCLGLSTLGTSLISQPDFAADIASLQNGQSHKLEARDDVPAGYVAPPYYPTPKGGWVADWRDAYAKAQIVVANMTLAEKVNLTTGTGLLMGPVCSMLACFSPRPTLDIG